MFRKLIINSLVVFLISVSAWQLSTPHSVNALPGPQPSSVHELDMRLPCPLLGNCWGGDPACQNDTPWLTAWPDNMEARLNTRLVQLTPCCCSTWMEMQHQLS